MDVQSLLQDLTIEHGIPEGGAATQYRAVYRKGTADAVVLTAWDTSRAYVRSQAEKILKDYAQNRIPGLPQLTISDQAKPEAAAALPRVTIDDVSFRKDGTIWLAGTPENVITALARHFGYFADADRVPANIRATTNDWVYQADQGNSILCRRALENAVRILAGGEGHPFPLHDLYHLLANRTAAGEILSRAADDSKPAGFFRHEYYGGQTGESSVWQASAFLREQLLKMLENSDSE